jgi:hypothetical protein
MNLFTCHKPAIDKLPYALARNIWHWQESNQSFNYKYFSDKEIDEWIKCSTSSYLFSAYSLLRAGAARADFFRIAYIHKCGGIWHDADLPAFSILEQRHDFIEIYKSNDLLLINNRKANGIRYTLIGGKSNTEILHEFLLDLASKIYEEEKIGKLKTIELTGPIAFHNFMRHGLSLGLSLEKTTKYKSRSIAYINDIVPEAKSYGEENTIVGYREMLKEMGVVYHSADKATFRQSYKLNSATNQQKENQHKIRLVHFHLAKTAGTSIVKYLKDELKEDLIVFNAKNQELFLKEARSKDWKIASGHFSGAHSPVRDYLKEYKRFTILRDPVDRFISFYKFICTRPHTGLHNTFRSISLLDAAYWCIENKDSSGVDMARNSQCSGIISNSKKPATLANAQQAIQDNYAFVCTLENINDINSFFLRANIIKSEKDIPQVNITKKDIQHTSNYERVRLILEDHLIEDFELVEHYQKNGSYFAV